MPIYEWKRTAYLYGRDDEDSTEYEETTTMDPPEQGNPEFYDEWKRVYSYGVGAVKGAGLSPARQVSGR